MRRRGSSRCRRAELDPAVPCAVGVVLGQHAQEVPGHRRRRRQARPRPAARIPPSGPRHRRCRGSARSRAAAFSDPRPATATDDVRPHRGKRVGPDVAGADRAARSYWVRMGGPDRRSGPAPQDEPSGAAQPPHTGRAAPRVLPHHLQVSVPLLGRYLSRSLPADHGLGDLRGVATMAHQLSRRPRRQTPGEVAQPGPFGSSACVLRREPAPSAAVVHGARSCPRHQIAWTVTRGSSLASSSATIDR